MAFKVNYPLTKWHQLSIEEFHPMWGASTQYDPFDILASGTGSTLAILTFELIAKRMKFNK